MVGQYRGLCFFARSRRKGRKILRPCPDKKRGHELLHGLESILWMMLSWRLVGSGSLSGLFSRSCGNRGSGSGRFWGVLQTDVKNGGFLRFVGAGHVVVAQGRDDKQYRHEAVILANRPPAPELPNTEALPPPKMTPIPSLPAWSRTRITRVTHTMTCKERIRVCTVGTPQQAGQCLR